MDEATSKDLPGGIFDERLQHQIEEEVVGSTANRLHHFRREEQNEQLHDFLVQYTRLFSTKSDPDAKLILREKQKHT
jgi:hypothetical protein